MSILNTASLYLKTAQMRNFVGFVVFYDYQLWNLAWKWSCVLHEWLWCDDDLLSTFPYESHLVNSLWFVNLQAAYWIEMMDCVTEGTDFCLPVGLISNDSFVMSVGGWEASSPEFSVFFCFSLNLELGFSNNTKFCCSVLCCSQCSVSAKHFLMAVNKHTSVCTFLPNAKKLLLTKMQQTLFKLTRVIVNLLVICQLCKPLDTVSYPRVHRSPFELDSASEHFRKWFKFPCMGAGFLRRGDSFQGIGISPFQSWKKAEIVSDFMYKWHFTSCSAPFSSSSLSWASCVLCRRTEDFQGAVFYRSRGQGSQPLFHTPDTPLLLWWKTIFSVDISKAALCTHS